MLGNVLNDVHRKSIAIHSYRPTEKWTESDVESTQGSKNPVRRLVKDKQSRRVPIHPDLLAMLRNQGKKTGLVIVGPGGSRLSQNRARILFVREVIKSLVKEFPTPENEVGFGDGRFHSFRHYFVSQCFVAGIPESDIRDWVGHSDSKIVELYRHLRQDVAKQNMNRIRFGGEVKDSASSAAS